MKFLTMSINWTNWDEITRSRINADKTYIPGHVICAQLQPFAGTVWHAQMTRVSTLLFSNSQAKTSQVDVKILKLTWLNKRLQL